MARLGLEVATLVKLGEDHRADTILAHLEHERVSTRFARRDPRLPTGAAVLVASHERNAAIFTFRGANTLLEPADLSDDLFAADLVYVSNLSNRSADCFPELVRRAKARGALVAANPGVRQLSARAGAFQQSLGDIDILALNRAEADVLVPRLTAAFGEGGHTLALAPGEEPPALAARGLTSGGFEMTLIAFLHALLSMGPRLVLLTDGGRGAWLGSKDAVLFCPAVEAKVAGTSGAGDAFASTFVAWQALGRPLAESLLAASVNAAAVVAHADTQTGLMTRDAIERLLTEMAQHKVRRWEMSGVAG
jgi:ribokinase